MYIYEVLYTPDCGDGDKGTRQNGNKTEINTRGICMGGTNRNYCVYLTLHIYMQCQSVVYYL